MSRLTFSRIHLNLPNNTDSKKDVIMDCLNSKISEASGKYAYTITDIESHLDYIKGYLTKYDPYGKVESVNKSTGKTETGGTANKVKVKSLFIINIKEMIIGHQSISNQISNRSFIDIFTKIFSAYGDNKNILFSISTITEKHSFFEEIKKIKKINRITLNLVPSNPANHDIWKDTDLRLRKLHISNYKEIQETNSEEGIIIDELTNSKFHMSEDGYGVAEVEGLDNLGKKTFSTTAKSAKEIYQNYPQSLEKKPLNSIIDFFSKTIELISKRTTHRQ